MIADDGNQFTGELTRAPSERKIVKTMIRFGDKHRNLAARRRRQKLRVHSQGLRELAERRLVLNRTGGRGFPLDSLEKDSRFPIPVLIRVKDVAAALKNPASHTRDEPRLVRAVKEGNERGGSCHEN
jgi:hypothetical protein